MADGDGATDIVDISGNGKGVALNVFPTGLFAAVGLNIITPQVFGAVGDGVANDGSAFLAAIAYLKANAIETGVQYGPGAATLHIPAGEYYLGTNTLDITCTMRIKGEGIGENGGVSTILRWDVGTTGIRVQSGNTSGAANVRTPDGYTGDGTIIEGLYLHGGYVDTESEAHGIHLRGRASIREVVVGLFPGDGLYVNVSAMSGGATEGNANIIYCERSTFAGCRNGVFLQGADSNAGTFIGIDALYNRRWGFYDNSFLGNMQAGHHTSGNGVTLVGGSVPYTMVSHGGNLFTPIVGQAVGASTNSPPATATDNTWWYYVRSGSPAATWPAWVSGISVRDGGPFFSSRSNFDSCYSEGDQAVAQFNDFAGNSGSSMQFAGIKGNGDWEKLVNSIGSSNSPGKEVNAGYRFVGNNPVMNGGAGLELYMLGGVGTINAYNRDGAVYAPLSLDALTQSYKINGVAIADLSVTGFNLASGKSYKINGVQVVGTRRAALPADATDLASVIALANAIKASMKTTGGHGLVED